MIKRIFKLINRLGATLDITDPKTVFFHTVDGMGLSNTMNFRNVGNRFVLTSSQTDQQTITGELFFKAQSDYPSIAAFLQEQPLTLTCTIYGTTYKRDVLCQLIEKGESKNLHLQSVSVSFPCLTPWYRELSVVTEVQEAAGGWIWDASDWDVTFSSAQSNTVIINSDAKMESPCKLTIYGEIVNPTWLHYVDGVLVESGSVSATVAASNYLVISNLSDPYTMAIYNGAGELVQDVYSLADFSTERFITLRKGSNNIVIQSESASSVTVAAEAQFYYGTI